MYAHYIKLNELFYRVNWYIFHKVCINLEPEHNDNQLYARWTVRLKYHWIQIRPCHGSNSFHFVITCILFQAEQHCRESWLKTGTKRRWPVDMTNLLYLYINLRFEHFIRLIANSFSSKELFYVSCQDFGLVIFRSLWTQSHRLGS